MKKDLASSLAAVFINSKITPVFIIFSFIIGMITLVYLPREEEPQISVPMVNIYVKADGLKADDVVELVTKPLEDIIKGIDGVEHVYSNTLDDKSVVTARFYVGEDEDRAILRIHETIRAHLDEIPYNIPMPLIQGYGINDVPILVLNLIPKVETSKHWNDTTLYNIAEELIHELVKIEEIGLSFIQGGHPSQLRIEPLPHQLNLYGITLNQLVDKVKFTNTVFALKPLKQNGKENPLIAGETLQTKEEIENLLISTDNNRLVYLNDVANVVMGSTQDEKRVWGWQKESNEIRPVVSIALAKRKGANAAQVADKVLTHLEDLKSNLIPNSLDVAVARNYGQTAKDKANSLLISLLLATLSIVIIITIVEGWREGLTVFVIIPMTILLTLFCSWQFGYTLNRVSLFALIFSIGILVDDAIVITENIKRHWQMGGDNFQEKALLAVKEIGAPTIMANLTILAALLPMLFVSGLMGPYMSPIPVNASVAVMLSLIIALIVAPWLMLRIKASKNSSVQIKLTTEGQDIFSRIFTISVKPVIATKTNAWSTIIVISVLTLLTLSFFYFKAVTVKMLPFDNKSELQILLDMPEGTTSYETERTLRTLLNQISDLKEIEAAWLYVGTSAPFNFNGLVRQHYLREAPHQAEMLIKLVPKQQRNQSHTVAQTIRQKLLAQPLTEKASLQVVEMPPGPPVFSTLLAEIYGSTPQIRRELAQKVKSIYDNTPFIVDTDVSYGDQTERFRLVLDYAQMEFFGVQEEAVLDTINALFNPLQVGYSHRGHGTNPIEISLELSQDQRVLGENILTTPIPSKQGVIELGDVVQIKQEQTSYPIFRRNGRFIEMVTGELAGQYEAPIYGMLTVNKALKEIEGDQLNVRFIGQPENEQKPSLLWEGEWEVTYVTFRDLGLAFAVALLAIYALLIMQLNSFSLPLYILAPIPLSLIGIVLGHWLFKAHFTATSMIGFISLAGIMIRNSLLLVEFIRMKLAEGLELKAAIIQAGCIRFKPIFMTAITAMVGASFMLSDPIFEGLGLSLLFGLASSTVLMMLVIPAILIISAKE